MRKLTAGLFVLALLASTEATLAADAALIAAAEKESTVTFYTTMILDQAGRPLVAGQASISMSTTSSSNSAAARETD